MNLLTIESTCDETAAAIITDQLEVLSSVVASQTALHEKYQGVVPEIAARAHVERILPVLDQTLREADLTLSEIDAVAVANSPGLAGSLLVGLSAAKALCLAIDKPLIAVNHLYAHIYARRLSAGRDVFPCVGLIVSGGHSSLYRCDSPTAFHYLGGTVDDAAGEAFDKVASMLGLPYPGGPAISKAAATGDPAAIAFPRSFIHEKQKIAFSFSGLKTAVRYHLAGAGNTDLSGVKLSSQELADVAASFEQAVVDCLATKAQVALQQTGLEMLCVGGGVAANRRLRERLKHDCEQAGIELEIAPIALCTDNAVMGAIAWEHYRAGEFAELDLDITPGLVRS
jgi:N6-L-threonylcarbamoyladenine synthase